MTGAKTSRVLLSSGQRNDNTASNLQTDLVAQALRLYLDVSDSPESGGGLAVVVRGYDRISGNAVELTTGGAPATDVGTYAYEMTPYPSGDAFGNIRESVSRAVPYQGDVHVLAVGGDCGMTRARP
jgi:hypothetical protein